MTTRNIELGSLLHGLLNSDFDNFLLYRYNELLRAIGDVISDKPSDKDNGFIDLLKNSLQRHIADNNRIIRDLQITVENEHIEEGFVSLNRVKLNNLQSVNEKSDCLIRDLEGIRLNISKEKPPLTPDNYESELTRIAEAENKFNKGIPMREAIQHFRIMTTKKSRNGAPYLSHEQFVSFLKRGFLKDHSQPKQKVNCASGEKGFVLKRFYEFYDLAASKYACPNRKETFIKLFTDCFDNWPSKSIGNLFKPDKVKERW